MSKTKPKLGIDVPPVTEDEALELMIHHLSLAASYYEATPNNYDNNYKEMERIMTLHNIPSYTSPALKAARVWLHAIDEDFKRMKNDD